MEGFMKRIVLFLLASVLMLGSQIHAQTWFKAATEDTSPIVTLKAGTTYRFGADTHWLPAGTTTAESIFLVNSAILGDPEPGVGKELDVLEISTVQTVTVTTNGVATIVTVPALAPPVPPVAQMANAFKVCSSPCTVTEVSEGAPLYLQTKSSTSWVMAFLFGKLSIMVQDGEIYAQESISPFDLTVSDAAGVHVVHVPVAPAGASNPAIALAKH
jgi:hypothetical protein